MDRGTTFYFVPATLFALLTPLAFTHPASAQQRPRHLETLGARGLADWEAGLEIFKAKVSTPSSAYNERSCATCHHVPLLGGGGFQYNRNLLYAVQNDYGIQHRFNKDVPIPSDATAISARQAPSLFGLGLIEQIPLSQILAREDPFDHDGDGISGVYAGRFGWQGQFPESIGSIVRGTFANELGTPATDEEVRLVTAFVRGLDPPRDPVERLVDAGTISPQELQYVIDGRAIFEAVGCNDCHVTEPYMIRLGPRFVARRVRGRPRPARPIVPMSDFLCHDMGQFLDDGVLAEGGCRSSSEWVTPPLWGTADRRVWMHDGSGARLLQSISLHGGEATNARLAAQSLSGGEIFRLERFLQELRY